jgi:hypothetical protein
MPGMTPAEKEIAGRAALSHFGTGLLNASGNLQGGTIFTALGRGFDAAERGALGAQQFDASTLAAQQEYQQKQQELRIAAIKEALPLLTLQQQMQQAQTARQLAGSGATAAAPVAGGTNIATGGSIAAPTYEGAIAGHEGAGKNPNSSATGVGQFLDSTWQGFTAANPDLFKGMTPAQVQAARNDPTIGAKAITWLAQQNADALVKQGVTPSGQSLGIAHYLGAGPTVAIMGAPDSAPVKGFVSDAAVKANPELATMTAGQLRQRYANTPSPGFLGTATAEKTPAPYQVAAAGSAVPPPPGAAPAAPTTDLTGPRPLPPTGPGAGVATPASIANTPVQTAQAQPPAVAPAVAPAPQTTPTPPPSPYPDIKAGDSIIRHPGTLAEFSAREFVPHPDAEIYNPNLTQQQQQAFAIEQQGLDLKQRQISALSDPVALQKGLIEVKAEQAALQAKIQNATHDKAQAASAEIAKYNDNQDKQVQARYLPQLAAYNEAAKTAQTASETRLTNKDQAVNAANQNGLIDAQKEQVASRDKVAALDGFRAISDGVGQPGWLQTTKMPGSDKTIAEQLGQLGMPLSDTAGVQLMHGAMTNLTRELRTGLAMGTLSDRDLDFVARLGPTDWMDPDTRAAAVGYLQQAYRAKMRFASDLQKEMSRGKNYGDAFDAADAKQKPFVPSAPADLTANWNDNSDAWVKARTKWAQENDVRPGTLFHLSDGSIHVMKSPKRQGQP